MSELDDIKNTLAAIKGDIAELRAVVNSLKAHDAWAVVVSDNADEDTLKELVDLKDQKKLVVRDLKDGTKFVSCT